MIDFHTHILPNTDDGSVSMEETMQLIKEAKSVGFSGIVLTSHYMENYYELNVEERMEKLKKVKNELLKEKIDIQLFLGNEIYFTGRMNELIKEKKACSINNTKYVLFELPFNIKPINLYDVIYDMQKNKNVPILAHPERYEFVQQNPNIIGELIQKGILMQCNFGSFIGQYGKKAKVIAKKLLQSDMIHFLGSDVHKENSIYKDVPQILKSMEKIVEKEKIELISKINPKFALENKEIKIKMPKEIKLSIIEKAIIKA